MLGSGIRKKASASVWISQPVFTPVDLVLPPTLPTTSWLVPVMFGLMGFVTGAAGPSRDLLVKRSTPDNATGRVYGVVYAGLDIGQAVAPLIIGSLMDRGAWQGVWLSLALLQGVLIVTAFRVRKVRRTVLAPA